jgi:sulfoxide reductase heme-binding subunit YedZ
MHLLDWLQKTWRGTLLNLTAAAIALHTWTREVNPGNLEPELASGKWAIRFLLLCLLMSPLSTYLGWKQAIKLRKPAGLWAAAFAGMHFLYYLIEEPEAKYLSLPLQPFIALGLVTLIILASLTITSNRFAMRKLGKNWKRLHRAVYAAGVLGMYHGLLAAVTSKKAFVRDPGAPRELAIYLGILTLLLYIRIPQVREWLTRRRETRPALRRGQAQVDGA